MAACAHSGGAGPAACWVCRRETATSCCPPLISRPAGQAPLHPHHLGSAAVPPGAGGSRRSPVLRRIREASCRRLSSWRRRRGHPAGSQILQRRTVGLLGSADVTLLLLLRVSVPYVPPRHRRYSCLRRRCRRCLVSRMLMARSSGRRSPGRSSALGLLCCDDRPRLHQCRVSWAKSCGGPSSAAAPTEQRSGSGRQPLSTQPEKKPEIPHHPTACPSLGAANHQTGMAAHHTGTTESGSQARGEERRQGKG